MSNLINKEMGLEFCMDDEEFYVEMLETYLEDSAEVVEFMKDAYANDDLGLYATKVHALKSTSKTIGAESLAELALELETAAKGNDLDTVKAKHDNCMTLYGDVVNAVREML